MKTYHDAVLKFSYSYPSFLIAQPQKDMDDAIQKEKDKALQQQDKTKGAALKSAFDCTKTPLVAMRQEIGVSLVLYMTIDGDCMGTTLEDKVAAASGNGALTNSLGRYGRPTISDPVSYAMEDLRFTAYFGSVAVKNGDSTTNLYEVASCALISNKVACWLTMATDQNILHKLLQDPIQFDGKTAQPLVPAELIPKS